MSTSHPTLDNVPSPTGSLSLGILPSAHASVTSHLPLQEVADSAARNFSFVVCGTASLASFVSEQHISRSAAVLLDEMTEWSDQEYRHAYADAAVEQGIAWQIRINREKRGWTQGQLAKAIGTKQSSISRIEDPEYGSHSLQQLMKVAHAFDCALIVKLAPYSTLARESKCLSEQHLFVASYNDEIGAKDEY